MSVTQTLPDISMGFMPFRNLWEKRWKDCKSQMGVEDTKETRPSAHRAGAHMNSETVAACTGIWTQAPIPNPKAVFNQQPLAKGKLVFSN